MRRKFTNLLLAGLLVSTCLLNTVTTQAASIYGNESSAASEIGANITVTTTEPVGTDCASDATVADLDETEEIFAPTESTGDFVESEEQIPEGATIHEQTENISLEVDLSPSAVYNAMIALKGDYYEGRPWTNDDFYAWKGGGKYYGGYGCAGFVFILSDAAFDTLQSRYIYSFEWDKFRVGDILRVNNDGHSVIILEKYDDYVIVAEGNYNSSIHWGRKITKSEAQSGFAYYVTRYPEDAGSNNNYNPKTDNTSNNNNNKNNTSNKSSEKLFSATDVRTGATEDFYPNNGTCKILVFGGIGSCGITTRVMKNITSVCDKLSLKYTELWAFDIQDNSNNQMRNVCDNYNIGSKMKVINKTTDGSKWNNVYVNCRTAAINEGLISNVLYMPLVAYVDTNGTILFESISSQSESDIETAIKNSGLYEKDAAAGQRVEKVQAFAERLYTMALSRSSDPTGLNNWTNELLSGKNTGANVASGFFFSEEFKNRNVSDSEYVELLYKVMMGRDSDEGGKQYWLYMLQNGVGREGVFMGFSGSKEFKSICSDYGIDAGDYTPQEARNKNFGLTTFVARLYTKALNRGYDTDGINYWCKSVLTDKTWGIDQMASDGFFHSNEFIGKNTSNEEYVTILYHTFFDREPDSSGFNYWIGNLNNGMTRDQVLYGFTASKEFGEIKSAYGL